MATLLGVGTLTVLWIFAASVGRDTTVRALLDHFADELRHFNLTPKLR